MVLKRITNYCNDQQKRIEEAQHSFKQYLEEGLLKKERQELAKQKYIDNADLSLKVASELMNSPSKPYLWIIVISYYSMFYIANAVLLHLGYKTQDKIVHKVTSDALIVLVLHRLTKELLEEYEKMRDDALEIANAKSEQLIESYAHELDKRSRFQYNMLEETKEAKANTSLERATTFVFEMKKFLK